MRVLIIGAGGHGQVVADILLRMGEQTCEVEPIGYVDDDPALTGCEFLRLPVLGTCAQVGKLIHDAVVVAVGDNRTRQRLAGQLDRAGERLFTARHPQAVVASDVLIGGGSMICAGVVVNPGCSIGVNTILNTSCSIDHHSRIGDHAHIGPGVRLGGEVTVGEGAMLGIGTAVIPRRRVGAWSVVGAGTLIHRDVADGVTVVSSQVRTVRRPPGDRNP